MLSSASSTSTCIIISECHQCSLRPNTEQTEEMQGCFGSSLAATGSYLAEP